MSRKKWRATVLQHAKDGFLRLAPEPPDSEFLESSVRVSAMNFSFPDPVLDPASILHSTPILADGDSKIGAVREILREVQTPDHQVKLSPPPSEHELKKNQLDSVNQRSFTAEETSQRICHWDAEVNTLKLHSELNDEQFSKFLHFSETIAEPTPEVLPARDTCVRPVIEADSVMLGVKSISSGYMNVSRTQSLGRTGTSGMKFRNIFLHVVLRAIVLYSPYQGQSAGRRKSYEGCVGAQGGTQGESRRVFEEELDSPPPFALG